MSAINNPLMIPTNEAMNIVPEVIHETHPELPEALTSRQADHILEKSKVSNIRKYRSKTKKQEQIKLKKSEVKKEPLMIEGIKNNRENNNTVDVIAEDLGVKDATYLRLGLSNKLLFIMSVSGFGLTIITSAGIITAIFLNKDKKIEIKAE